MRIPIQGGEVGGGAMYKLSRANLAMSYGFILNWNMFLEMPRQNGKTVSALCYYLWVFLFGTRNSRMLFLNKKLEDSKMNLQTLKDIRSALPDYLRMDAAYSADGKRIKGKQGSVEQIHNPSNNNLIKTAPSARNKMLASNLGRGATLPFIYFDEYAFIPFNYMIYQTAAPAFSTASRNAAMNGAPFGMLITTTPGDLLTDEGREAFDTKEMATRFSENWYDATIDELKEIKKANTKSNFIYIRYTYKELGRTEEYFEEMVKDLKSNWAAIRREILLEWSESTENSPFEKNDLDTVKRLIKKPIREIWIGKPVYIFYIYKEALLYKYPPIIGVDPSGGFSHDSSAITIIDTQTTEVMATFNCNFIPITDLAKVIYQLVMEKMPNAIVNVERNGGFGSSVLSYLLSKPEIKKNLYFEIKDRVFEEKFDGMTMQRNTKRVRVYGSDNTKENRNKLMEILRDRMAYHKDKFHAEIIYNELAQLEVKKNGRIEHADNGHDDQIFSYLWALYVWYYGKNLMENWHLVKTELKIEDDSEIDDISFDKENGLIDIGMEIVEDAYDDDNEDTTDVAGQIKAITGKKFILHSDFIRQEEEKDRMMFNKMLSDNPIARKSYAQKYNIDESELVGTMYNMSSDIDSYYMDEEDEQKIDPLQSRFNSLSNLR